MLATERRFHRVPDAQIDLAAARPTWTTRSRATAAASSSRTRAARRLSLGAGAARVASRRLRCRSMSRSTAWSDADKRAADARTRDSRRAARAANSMPTEPQDARAPGSLRPPAPKSSFRSCIASRVLVLGGRGCVETRFESPIGDNAETCAAALERLWIGRRCLEPRSSRRSPTCWRSCADDACRRASVLDRRTLGYLPSGGCT